MKSSTGADVLPQGNFHHIGFVVASIQTCVQEFVDSLQAEWDGVIFYDPNQDVRVTFLRGERPANPTLELVEPASENSPVIPFLKRGGGLHHLCYEVTSLEDQLALSRAQGALLVKPPLPAVAFEGRRIAWVYTRNKLLLEFLERPGPVAE
jgi:methylmalonyl-CoA/ethylmalonyl-CoA epimerase